MVPRFITSYSFQMSNVNAENCRLKAELEALKRAHEHLLVSSFVCGIGVFSGRLSDTTVCPTLT